MKLKLNNLVYDTDNPVRIERLKDMGAVEIEVNTAIKADAKENDNIEDLAKAQLIELLEEKGIEFKANAKKEELMALLSETDEGEMESEEE